METMNITIPHFDELGHCGKLWHVDDFSKCARVLYLDTYFPLILLSTIIICMLGNWLHLSRNYTVELDYLYSQNGSSNADESQPLLNDGSGFNYNALEVEMNGANGDANNELTIGEAVAKQHFDLSNIIPMKEDGTPVSITKVVHRDYTEKAKVILEVVLVFAEVVLNGLPLFIKDLGVNWSVKRVNYSTPILSTLSLWIFLFIISLIRVSHLSKGLSFKYPNLWYFSTTAYMLSWFPALLQFRSASLNHMSNNEGKSFYIAHFIIVTLLSLLTGCSKFSDRPAILHYDTKDSIPSLEECTSFFSHITYSYLDPMVFSAYKSPILEKEITGLTADDSAYNVLTRFHMDKSKLRFTWKLFSQFKWQFFTQALLTCIDAVLQFVPALLMKKLLEYIKNPEEESASLAWFYVMITLLSSFIALSCNGRCLFIGRKVCTRMKAILIGEIYAKGLRRRVTTHIGAEDAESTEETKDVANTSDASSASDESNSEDKDFKDLGSIINLMSVDAFKVSEICGYLHYFVNSIVMAVVCVFLLYNLLGWPALVGAGTCIFSFPISYKLSAGFGEIQKDMLAVTDRRIQKLNEAFQNIRIIKFFAWEEQFSKAIQAVREEELGFLWKRTKLWVFSLFVYYLIPFLMTLVAFYTYTEVAGHLLTTPIAFSAVALFNLLRAPLDMLADMTALVVQSKVSLDRVEDFLKEPECDKYQQLSHSNTSFNTPLIGFQNASFSWQTASKDDESSNDFKLRNLDIEFKAGKLNVVMGPTGSGKSSLLLALLGEMNLLEGSVYLPGIIPRDVLVPNPITGLTESVAYCSQTAWLLNGTIKENIIFASAFNKERYQAVIDACALTRDLEILDDGDETEVGEKGITLSGGQKQRVSLARALYSSSAYVLLDDCLSAVDSHTSAHIFEHCIMGPLMKGRTCVLVTHNVALVGKYADHIVCMDNGRVSSQGSQQATNLLDSESEIGTNVESTNVSYSDLSALNALNKKSKEKKGQSSRRSSVAADVTGGVPAVTVVEMDINDDVPVIDEELTSKKKHKLIEDEAKAEGFVSKEVYAAYFGYFGGYWIWIFCLFIYFLAQANNIFLSYWIKKWAESEDKKVISLISTSLYAITSNLSLQSASSTVTSMISLVDWNKPIVYQLFSVSTLDGHGTMYYIWIYLGACILYGLLAAARLGIALVASLRVSRIMFNKLLFRLMRAKLRFFDSTPVGRIINRFSKDMEGIDQELASYIEGVASTLFQCGAVIVTIMFVTPAFIFFGILVSIAYYWIGLLYIILSRDLKRYESITKSPIHQQFSETLVGVTTIRAYGDERRFVKENLEKIDKNNKPFYYVWIANRWLAYRTDVIGALISFFAFAFAVAFAHHLDAGVAGISLSFALTFTSYAVWIVRCYAQVEINMNSVERLEEYMNVDQEPPAHVDPSQEPPASWPSTGEIEVRDLSLRYAPALPKVIDGVSFDVKPCSKIGIVGRTGAGKSTIITAFFRFLDPETGYIKIDGYDITKIGLQRLRSGITIIPQDPTLFTGTIRSNLDPFSEYSDLQIFEALKRVSLLTAQEYETVIKNGTPPPAASSSNNGVEVDASEENANKFLNLSNSVTEGGANLSQGQRQLTCLARSLLKSPKIIMLDEATASIDYESDAKIQHTIRDEFSGSTILTIAHRLKTIIDYDMILVLDAGKVKEFDTPHNLITREGSQFRSMCQDSGEFTELVRLAKEASK